MTEYLNYKHPNTFRRRKQINFQKNVFNIRYNDYSALDDAVAESRYLINQYGIQSNAAYEKWVEINGVK
jgi:uncharacterized membrane protein YvbJ